MAGYDMLFSPEFNSASMAEAMGGYGERVKFPDDLAPALEHAIERTESGNPAMGEVVDSAETTLSRTNLDA